MKVTTFSRFFPVKHPKAGQPTNFVEKMWIGLIQEGDISVGKAVELSKQTGIGDWNMYNIRKVDFAPKHHTIRAGNRWKVGEQFSPRVWSGTPYQSKQIEIAPPITIEKIWEITIEPDWYGEGLDILIDGEIMVDAAEVNRLALNDGLSMGDFFDWFAIHPKKSETVFTGQILCWNKNINY